MAADKKIMAEIETLRLDRPGRMFNAGCAILPDERDVGPLLIAGLRELARTYREEAELWSRSGAKGWKSSEAEKYLVAQHIDDVTAQLDNAGGGAALSVSEPAAGHCGGKTMHDPHRWSHPDGNVGTLYCEGVRPSVADDDLETELRESAKRIDAVHDVTGLDALIADSVAARKGHVRDELLPEGHPARSDAVGERQADGSLLVKAADVTAYLSGAVDDLPGLADALVPGSVTDATVHLGNVTLIDNGDGSHTNANAVSVTVGTAAGVRTLTTGEHDHPTTLPTTWESETLTADGHTVPGAPRNGAPLLGQPGNASAGYSHTYVPPGGRTLAFAELLQPVPAAALPPHLSHSQIGDVGDCATQYRLQRVEQVPQVPQWANIGGSAFHAAVEAIERTAAQGLSNGMPLDFGGFDCELSWKHHFEEQIRFVSSTSPVPISMWRAARKGAEGRAWWDVNGPQMLRRYLDARPTDVTMSTTDGDAVMIEYEIIVDMPTPYGPVPFKAVLDRVTVGHVPGHPERGALTIRDYKSSYERPTDATQLGEYAHALRLHFAALGGGPLMNVPIYGTYFDARRGTWTEPVDLLAEHPFEAFQYRVTAAHGQKRALTVGPTPARPSSYCGGCSVRYACPIMNQLKAVGR